MNRTPRPSFPSSRVPASAVTMEADDRAWRSTRVLTTPSLRDCSARGPSESWRACVVSYADSQPAGCAEQTWTHSRIAGAERPSIPPLARRAQGLSERQRAINRSVLRLLAYPQRDCRRRLTTWKKNGRCVAPARVRRANLYPLQVCTRWRSLKPCARHGERSILREAPQGRSDKCGVSPHCPRSPGSALGVAPLTCSSHS